MFSLKQIKIPGANIIEQVYDDWKNIKKGINYTRIVYIRDPNIQLKPKS